MKDPCQKRCWHRVRGLALTSAPEEGEPWLSACVGEDADIYIYFSLGYIWVRMDMKFQFIYIYIV